MVVLKIFIEPSTQKYRLKKNKKKYLSLCDLSALLASDVFLWVTFGMHNLDAF